MPHTLSHPIMDLIYNDQTPSPANPRIRCRITTFITNPESFGGGELSPLFQVAVAQRVQTVGVSLLTLQLYKIKQVIPRPRGCGPRPIKSMFFQYLESHGHIDKSEYGILFKRLSELAQKRVRVCLPIAMRAQGIHAPFRVNDSTLDSSLDEMA